MRTSVYLMGFGRLIFGVLFMDILYIIRERSRNAFCNMLKSIVLIVLT